jgi:hypothetical protein
MKKVSKKIVGGLMISVLVASIVVVANAQSDDTDAKDITRLNFFGKRHMNQIGPFVCNLTDEQQAELNELITSLRNENATFEEIHAVIKEKLDEYGVLDERLDNKIAQTELQLSILNREKELRDQGYSWEEIRNIIQEEFNLELPADSAQGNMYRHDFGHESCRGAHGFIPDKKINQ